MVVVVVCGDGAGIVLDGIELWGVTVVRWGEHHGGLVCLCVLMVKVDNTSTAVRGSRHTVQEHEEEEGWHER